MVKATPGVPDSFKTYSCFPFGGIDLEGSPLAIDDKDFYYLENFIRTGDGYLRTAWDAGASVYTASLTIVSFNFFTIGPNYYAIVFLSDGSAVQVAVPPTGAGATTTVAAAGTFYLAASGFLPAVSQWGDQFIIISNRNTPNDYWVWDGSLLYGAGGLAPTSLSNPTLTSAGSGYNSAPTVSILGGSGTGATAVASVQAGSIVNLQVTNPGTGYGPSDVVQAVFSGGGSDSGAYLTASLGAGGVAAIEVTAPGSGYSSAPTVTVGGGEEVTGVTVTNGGIFAIGPPTVSFSGGGGTGAAGTVTTAPFSGSYFTVVGVTITNPGSGYTSAPTVSFTGSQLRAVVATAIVSVAPTATATESGGAVTEITVTSPGSGYVTAPPVTLSGGGGSGATAVALLGAGGVSAITVVDVGSGYVRPPLLSFVGGGGAGATGGVVLTPTSVAAINVTNSSGGTEFTAAPTVTITSVDGNGSGATAVATISGGALAYVTLVDPGSGYTTPPAVTFSGGAGLGTPDVAAAAAALTPTTIASAYVSNSGFGYTSAPAVLVLAGSNNAASATLDLMPFGVSGSCLETFNSRVWIANPAPPLFGTLPPGGNFSFSAAGSFTNFSTVAGGGEFTNSDRFLLTSYEGLRQSNGYLYVFGDGSVSVISNVQTIGSPATTTFTYQNVEPQAGLTWRDSMQDFGRAVTFGNETGRYGLYGGNVTKISGKLDRLFLNALFPPTGGAVAPSGATATLFDVKHDLMLMTIVDPDTGLSRNVMATWNEKTWTITSQTVNLLYIGPQKVKSVFTAWGTDGTKLYPLFQQPSAALVKRLDTKVYGVDSLFLIKDLYSLHVTAQDLSSGQSGVAASVTFNTSGPAQQALNFNSTPSGAYASVPIGTLNFAAPSPAWPVWTSGTKGLPFNLIGMRLESTSSDFVLGFVALGYVPVSFTN